MCWLFVPLLLLLPQWRHCLALAILVCNTQVQQHHHKPNPSPNSNQQQHHYHHVSSRPNHDQIMVSSRMNDDHHHNHHDVMLQLEPQVVSECWPLCGIVYKFVYNLKPFLMRLLSSSLRLANENRERVPKANCIKTNEYTYLYIDIYTYMYISLCILVSFAWVPIPISFINNIQSKAILLAHALVIFFGEICYSVYFGQTSRHCSKTTTIKYTNIIKSFSF